MQWQCSSRTDAGKVRKINEDSIYHNDEQQLWVVADGMGGHHRGDIASQTVVRYLETFAATPHTGISLQRIDNLLTSANAELIEKAETEGADIVASTCALMLRHKNTVVCVWVGDSRVYRYRRGKLTQLTRDHSYESLLEDLRNAGEKVDDFMVNTQTLTRGIGAENHLQVEKCHFSVESGDRYPLCTDGLYKEVSDQELLDYYKTITDDETLVATLHQAYLDGGARDNLGVILVTTN